MALVSSIFGLAAAAAIMQAPNGFVYCFFLLNTTAVEAAVGMSIIIRLLHTGRAVSFSEMRTLY